VRVVAFIGSSGTGKSHRALWVARENHIDYVIDDGLLIHDNGIVAGHSAKKAPTKIGSVKAALFQEPNQTEEMKAAFKKYNPKSILILGTSEGMVEKITSNLGIGPIEERIYIQDVASSYEIEQAKNTRIKQGKHVIPVPAMELKKQFSGYFLDPMQLFRKKGKGDFQHIGEKSVVRPTFSYFGKFIISDYAIFQVVQHILSKFQEIEKITRFFTNTTSEGLFIDMDIVMVYGFPLRDALKRAQDNISTELDRFAGLNVKSIVIQVKSLTVKPQASISKAVEPGETR
jgi:uncharacterized alkaline shock family protein YloU